MFRQGAAVRLGCQCCCSGARLCNRNRARLRLRKGWDAERQCIPPLPSGRRFVNAIESPRTDRPSRRGRSASVESVLSARQDHSGQIGLSTSLLHHRRAASWRVAIYLLKLLQISVEHKRISMEGVGCRRKGPVRCAIGRRRRKREHSAGAEGTVRGPSLLRRRHAKRGPEFARAPAIGGGALTRRRRARGQVLPCAETQKESCTINAAEPAQRRDVSCGDGRPDHNILRK